MTDDNAPQLLLLRCAQLGMKGAPEASRGVYCKAGSLLETILATLCRLKFLELSFLQIAMKELGMPPKEVVELTADAQRAVTALLVSSGSLDAETAKAYLSGSPEAIALDFEALAAKAARDGTVAEALKDLAAAEKLTQELRKKTAGP